MATFRKRSNRWQARIRRTGYPDIVKTFISHSDAVSWARDIESKIDKGTYLTHEDPKGTVFSILLNRYLNQVTLLKKHPKPEVYRIKTWLKSPLASRYIETLKSSDFALWRDLRLKQGMAGNTVKLELAVISHLYFVARAEWGFEGLDNPIRYIRKPKIAKGRNRRVTDEEIELLIKHTGSGDLPVIIKLAIETGMRRGEIASINWKDVNFQQRTIQLWDTKNGEDRKVPLSTKAVELLQNIPRREDGKLFGMNAHAITYAFIRASKRCGLVDLHFHDLRHEATTRLSEKLPNILELSAVTGHKELKMLKRYYHPKAEELALKLG